MLACVYGAYLIVGSKFNDQVALIRKCIYIYIEVFSLQPRDQIFISVYIIVGLC